MNWDMIRGDWKRFKGKVRERWGRLSDDDLDTINGRREQLEGRLQKAYGRTHEEAQREVEEFCTHCRP